jgi:hypothetical protein
MKDVALVALLVRGIKEQRREIKALKSEVAALDARR